MIRKFLCMVCLLCLLVLASGCSKKTADSPGVNAPAANPSTGGQEEIVRNAFKKYFKIAKDFSSDSYESEKAYKTELKKRYSEITTASLLADFNRFVDDGSTQSDYFLSTFLNEINCQVKEISGLKVSPESISGQATINNEYEFSAMVDDFESNDFISNNKVVNMTQQKFTELIREYNPTGINSTQVLKYTFSIVRVNQVWKFDKLEGETIESKLLELHAWDGKTVQL